MELPGWVPEGVEVTVPNAARMYDYALGGYHNFAVDREFVERAEELMPGAIASAHANRAFVRRAVRWLVSSGLRQFLFGRTAGPQPEAGRQFLRGIATPTPTGPSCPR